MVQQPALHAISTPLCGSNVTSDEGGCSSQQIAAAWAWFEHSGATCITPRRAEGLRGAAHLRSAHRQPSRFKKEFLAALALRHPDIKEESSSCTSASPAVLPLRRHSFHDKSNGNLTERCDKTVHSLFRSSSARFAGMSDQERHAYVNNLLNQMLQANDSNGDKIGSTLMDEFEQEAVWQQMLHRIAHADIAYVAKCNGTTESRMDAKTEHNRNLEAYKLNLESIQQSSQYDNGREEQNNSSTARGPNFKHSPQQSHDSAKTGHFKKSAAYGSNFEYGKLSPEDASSHRKLSSSDMHKGNPSYQDNHLHSRSPRKHFHQHRSSSPPDLLYHLLHFRNGKPARSPALCSSISTADSIKNYRLLPPLASKPKAKQQAARLRDSKSMELNCIDADCMQSISVVRKDDKGEHKGLDNDHYHRHRHVHLHHHHHHHHHVLHHREEHAMILDHIMTKEGRKGIPMSPRKSRPKLHIDGSMQGTLLGKKHSHDYYERNEGPTHKGYGYLEKDEYLLHLPYVDYQHRSSFS